MDRAASLERWATDFKLFAEDLLQVQTVEGDLVPFRFNEVQVALHEIMGDIEAHGRLKYVIVDKLRRAGCSTYFDGRGFWYTSFRPRTNALIITHEPEATDTIFGMTKRFYANLPENVRPKVLYDNRKALVFNTRSRVGGLDSEIRVGTAGKENLGSSQKVNFAHFSEFSKWNAAVIDDLMSSLMPTIPKTLDAELIIESTANGIGNRYHSTWLEARYDYQVFLDAKGQIAWRCVLNEKAPEGNVWSRIFVPWFVFHECELSTTRFARETGKKFEPTAEELQLAALHFPMLEPKRRDRKLAWRRYTIINDFKGDLDRFYQEYPSTWQESFTSSGEAAFDTIYVGACLEQARQLERQNPCKKYEVDPVSGQFFFTPRGRLWVWEEPQPGESYAIPADVAQGIVVDDKVGGDKRHDASVASVKHQLTGREVAQWWGKLDADLFGRLLVWLAIRYNQAWLIPENNKDGNTAISAILAMNYKRLYVERVLEPPNPPRKRYGFSTQGGRQGGVRAEAINSLIASVRDKRHGIRSTRTLEEMLTFKRSVKGRYEAERGSHDDCVITEAIAKYAIPLLPLPAQARLVTATSPLAPRAPGPSPGVLVPAGPAVADAWS